MKQLYLTATLAFISILGLQLYAQVGINSDNSAPDSSAMLDVSSTTKGFLPPRMTQTQRVAISSPATGLLIYQTDGIQGYYNYNGTNWVSLTSSGAGGNSPSTCIDYDGNSYATFTLGTQTWMAENLRVVHYRNGEAIPNVTGNSAWAALTSGAYCWYNNDQATYAKYGTLYNWHAVNDFRGLCPQGWHAPTNEEWTALTTYLGGDTYAGGKMKSLSALWTSPNVDATDNSRFSGLPGSFRGDNGTFGTSIGTAGCWWTSSVYSSSDAHSRGLLNSLNYVIAGTAVKKNGYSVRCLRD